MAKYILEYFKVYRKLVKLSGLKKARQTMREYENCFSYARFCQYCNDNAIYTGIGREYAFRCGDWRGTK